MRDELGFGQAAYEAWGKGPPWEQMSEQVRAAWDAAARAAISDFIDAVAEATCGDIAAIDFHDLREMAGLVEEGEDEPSEPTEEDREQAEYERLRAKYGKSVGVVMDSGVGTACVVRVGSLLVSR